MAAAPTMVAVRAAADATSAAAVGARPRGGHAGTPPSAEVPGTGSGDGGGAGFPTAPVPEAASARSGELPAAPPVQGCLVELFRRAGFGERRAALSAEGVYDGARLQAAGAAGKLRSLIVSGPCSVTLYEFGDFSGWAAVFDQGFHDTAAIFGLGRRRAVHALKIERATPRLETAIPIVTVDTRVKERVIRVRGVTGRWLANVGAGKTWTGWRAKVEAYEEPVRKQAVRDPTQLMILMDDDLFSGGCSDSELRERYQKVVAASGGVPVVVSADPHQYPSMPNGVARYQRFQPRREVVLHAFNVSADALQNYTDNASASQDYFFVNSGFIMGPASYLLQVVKCMSLAGWDAACWKDPICLRPSAGIGAQCCFDDQRGLSKCFLSHPELITIDYAGTLAFTTFGMYNIFQVEEAGGVRNAVLGTTQCFIHGNCHECPQPFGWPGWLEGVDARFNATAPSEVVVG